MKASDLENDEGIAQDIADSSRNPGEEGSPLTSIKRFDKVFEEFWTKLIKKAQPKKILTADFLSLLGYWIAVISGCPSRAFRHTGTFTALRIITALNDILAQQQKELTSTEVQIEAEGKHGKTARLNTLKTKASRLNEAMASLSSSMLDTFFKGVFTQRFRDLEADIRALCIEGLGTWINRNPTVWLEDEYVKYLGWDAHDHDASTRLATLKGIEKILADEAHWEKMAMFSERFRERFVSATLDKDSSCAVTAIKICEHLLKAGIMQQADIDSVCSLTSDKDPKIRQAAGSFVFQHVFVGLLSSNTDSSVEPAPKQKKRELTALVEFVLKISFIDLPNYLVESLWGRLYVLTDWDAQVTSLKESADNRAQQTALAQTLLCCIKRALGFSITPSAKQTKSSAGENQTISKYFMEHLPELLDFFRTEDHVLVELVEIPRYLDLEGYRTYHLENKFTPLLQSLGTIFSKSSSKTLIEAIGGSLQILLSDHPLKKQAEKAVTTLAQKLTTYLGKSTKGKTTIWTLQKAGTLLLIYDLTDYGFPEHAVNALQGVNKANKEERRDLINSALRVLWLDAVHSVNLLAEQKQPTTASIAVVVEKRERLLQLVEEYLKDADAGVQLDTFPVAVETLLAFKRGWLNTPLSLIAYSATDDLHDALTQCIEQNIDRTPEEADSAPAGNEVQQERAELLALATERQELLISGVDRAIATSNLRRDMAVPILVRYNTFSKSTQALVKRLYHDIRAIYENSEWQVVLATLKRVQAFLPVFFFALFLLLKFGTNQIEIRRRQLPGPEGARSLHSQHVWSRSHRQSPTCQPHQPCAQRNRLGVLQRRGSIRFPGRSFASVRCQAGCGGHCWVRGAALGEAGRFVDRGARPSFVQPLCLVFGGCEGGAQDQGPA